MNKGQGLKEEMTVTSSAAGRPRSQIGRKMSAGQLCDPGMREGTSTLGNEVRGRRRGGH